MSGFQKVIIAGALGKDPEVRYSASGTAVANLSVATSEKYKDEERTEWHRIVAFGKTAELAGKYLNKGSFAIFEGKLQTNKWQDKNGNDRYTTEIICQSVTFGPRAQPKEPPKDYLAEDKPEEKGGMVYDDIPFAPIDWRAS